MVSLWVSVHGSGLIIVLPSNRRRRRAAAEAAESQQAGANGGARCGGAGVRRRVGLGVGGAALLAAHRRAATAGEGALHP
jgi:hypothetical protein